GRRGGGSLGRSRAHGERRRDRARLEGACARRGRVLRAVERGVARGRREGGAPPGKPRRLHRHRPWSEGPDARDRARAAADPGRSRPRRHPGRGPMKLRAPATSANLGPGFDCAAVALDLWNELEVTDGEGVVVEGEGAEELPADDSNLAVRAFALVASPAGKRFVFRNGIPLERGLGSSAAAIALGLAAASRGGHSPAELLALGGGLESHQDNLGAALAGGACVTWRGHIAKIAQTLPLQPIAVIPESRVVTEEARHALPPQISHED